jgi:solute:Na+ symporter, SSS family
MTLYIPAALVGLGGAIVMPGLDVPDRIFPELLIAYAPAWLTGIILAGATAAAMSTLDSILHSNMTVLTRDIYQRYLAPKRDADHYVLVGRLIVLALLVVGYALSVTSFSFLVTLVTLSGAGALQLMPGVLGVCYPTRRPFTRNGVLSGLGAGLATLYVTLVVVPHPYGVHAAMWSLGVNFLVCWIVSRLSAPPSVETVDRIHGAIEAYVYRGEEP